MNAAARVLILEFLTSAETVRRLPITPTIMMTSVKIPAVVTMALEYLERRKSQRYWGQSARNQ
jgi:hypothetical protein